MAGPLLSPELEAVLPRCMNESWPEVCLSWREGEEKILERLDDREAVLAALFGGHLQIEREAAAAVFVRDEPVTPDLVAHPGLAGVGVVYAHWEQRLVFHAGAVLTSNGAVAVTGPKGAGKSTTLALLAAAGYPVLADDLVVIEAGHVLAGPRLVDLRRDAAERLAPHGTLVVVRGGQRWRVMLPEVPVSAPLVGWAVLNVQREAGVATVAPSDRAGVLAEHLVLSPGDQLAFLDAITASVWRLSRPSDWAEAHQVVDTFAKHIGGPADLPAGALS